MAPSSVRPIAGERSLGCWVAAREVLEGSLTLTQASGSWLLRGDRRGPSPCVSHRAWAHLRPSARPLSTGSTGSAGWPSGAEVRRLHGELHAGQEPKHHTRPLHRPCSPSPPVSTCRPPDLQAALRSSSLSQACAPHRVPWKVRRARPGQEQGCPAAPQGWRQEAGSHTPSTEGSGAWRAEAA